MDEPQRQLSDRAQMLYKRHNTADTKGEAFRCSCDLCAAFRRLVPRLAATIDSELEMERRVYQYRVLEDYS